MSTSGPKLITRGENAATQVVDASSTGALPLTAPLAKYHKPSKIDKNVSEFRFRDLYHCKPAAARRPIPRVAG